MYAQVEKAKENKSRAIANSMTQKNINGKQGFGFVDNRPENVAQRKMQSMANDSISQPIQKKENNTGLPDNLKTGIENLSGYSMDDVKVHRNSDKPGLLQAHAYAQGRDIHLASGQEKHLPHEAWHVMQQKEGRVKPTIQMKGNHPVNDGVVLENEADLMGAKLLQMMHMPNDAPVLLKSKSLSAAPIQRLKKASEFDLDEREDAELIAKINQFHEAREKVGTDELDWQTAEPLEDLLLVIRRQAEAKPTEITSVIEDVGEELMYLSENNKLRPVADLDLSATTKEIVEDIKVQEPDRQPDKISNLDVWKPESKLGSNAKAKVTTFIQSATKQLVAPPKLIEEVISKLWKANELSSDYNEVIRLIRPVVGLALRIFSIAKTGIKPEGNTPSEESVQTSSDVGKGRGVSHYFDIQNERNTNDYYNERFPKPGTSSASVATERVHDRIETAGWVINLAKEGHGDALKIIENFIDAQDEIITLNDITGTKNLMADLGDWVRDGPRDSPEKQFLRLLASGRSHYTAMFASTGKPLAESAPSKLVGKKEFAPDVRELESSAPMKPQYLTHVIVPSLMDICIEFLVTNVELKIILVQTKLAKDFTYWDAEVMRGVAPGDVLVPDYDSAIAALASSGKSVLTHITRGPA